MSGNVYYLRAKRLPRDTASLLDKLVEQAHDLRAPLEGLAFIAYVDDHGFIADVVGKALENPEETLRMLTVLMQKVLALLPRKS